MTDLERRLDAVPHLSSDGLVNYQQAIVRVFGKDTPYTRLVFDEKTVLSGSPDTSEAGTSFVERWNLTCRQQNARYRRKTLAFSKSVEQHLNQVALSILHYNWVRIHGSLKTTPAVAAGLVRNPEDLERPIRRKVNTESGEVEQQIRDVEHRIRGS